MCDDRAASNIGLRERNAGDSPSCGYALAQGLAIRAGKRARGPNHPSATLSATKKLGP